MKLLSCLLVLLVLIATIALPCCAPNRSILQDKTAQANAAAADKTPEPPSPPTRMTIAKLMDRVAGASPDSFLFPCTMAAYSVDDREKLRKFRQKWLSKEDDARYTVSPATGCVCPDFCVLKIEDTKTSSPNNLSLIVYDPSRPGGFYWLTRNKPLVNTELAWQSSVPFIYFRNPDGSKAGRTCRVEWNKMTNRYGTACTDEHGKSLPSLESR